jgi:bacterioferritin (cytochrome b1)
MVGETVPEQLNTTCRTGDATTALNRVALCRRSDNGSRDLLEDILEGEEAHADWLSRPLSPSSANPLSQRRYIASNA